MKALLFSASLLLWTICSPAAEGQLRFTGSFWDRADSFSLAFDLTSNPVTLHWDGYPDNDLERKKGSEGRFQVDLELSEEESASIRKLASHFHLCHPGQRAVIGTGLSVRATLTKEETESFSYSYFSLDLTPRLGLRGENFPLLFQSLIRDGTLTGEERSRFFEEVDSFAGVLSDYQTGLDLLAEHQAAESPVPWGKLKKLVERPYFSWWGEGDAEFAASLSEETAHIVDALLEPKSIHLFFDQPPEKVLLQIGAISGMRDEYHDRTLPLPGLSGERDEWALLSSELKSFLEDYVNGPYSKKYWSMRHLDHPLFEIPIPQKEPPSPQLIQRLEFIDNSQFIESLFPDTSEQRETGYLNLFTMDLEEQLSRCVVLTTIDGKVLYTLLFVEDGVWKILRQIDQRDWQEYGWKEPLFK